MSSSEKFNRFAQEHSARKNVWDENLKLRYKPRTFNEFTASVYGEEYKDFPAEAIASPTKYDRWCVSASRMFPPQRDRKEFRQYMQERLFEAKEAEILPDTEDGAEVGSMILTILKSKCRIARNFSRPPKDDKTW